MEKTQSKSFHHLFKTTRHSEISIKETTASISQLKFLSRVSLSANETEDVELETQFKLAKFEHTQKQNRHRRLLHSTPLEEQRVVAWKTQDLFFIMEVSQFGRTSSYLLARDGR